MRRLMRERHCSYCGKELFGGAIKRSLESEITASRRSAPVTTTATALAVPVCTLASGWYHSFYKIEKSITGRRAHNPIHPGSCHRWCSSLFCGETNRPCRVDMMRSSKMVTLGVRQTCVAVCSWTA